MNELIKIENTINIKGNNLQVVEYKGVRVLSSYDIARLHGKEVAQVNRQFERNKDRLKEDIDYFLVDKGEFSECLAGIQSFIPNNVKDIKLFTEKGYLKLVKSFTDDLSWEITDLLADKYFVAKQILQTLSDVTLDLSDTHVLFKDNDFYTSSLSIAKLTGKRHDNVLRDIENEVNLLKSESIENREPLDAIINGVKEVSYIDSRGRVQKAYDLSEEATYQMLLRYSPVIRALFIHKFKQMKDAVLNMYKLKVLDSVLPEHKGKRQYVYIIKNLDTGNIKVGVGVNPIKRLEQLQTGSDSELSLVYTSFLCSNAFSIEKEVHKHFKDKHVRGEWFKISEKEVIRYLEQSKYSLSSEFTNILKEDFE